MRYKNILNPVSAKTIQNARFYILPSSGLSAIARVSSPATKAFSPWQSRRATPKPGHLEQSFWSTILPTPMHSCHVGSTAGGPARKQSTHFYGLLINPIPVEATC
jgi:hypothetical protein